MPLFKNTCKKIFLNALKGKQLTMQSNPFSQDREKSIKVFFCYFSYIFLVKHCSNRQIK